MTQGIVITRSNVPRLLQGKKKYKNVSSRKLLKKELTPNKANTKTNRSSKDERSKK